MVGIGIMIFDQHVVVKLGKYREHIFSLWGVAVSQVPLLRVFSLHA